MCGRMKKTEYREANYEERKNIRFGEVFGRPPPTIRKTSARVKDKMERESTRIDWEINVMVKAFEEEIPRTKKIRTSSET